MSTRARAFIARINHTSAAILPGCFLLGGQLLGLSQSVLVFASVFLGILLFRVVFGNRRLLAVGLALVAGFLSGFDLTLPSAIEQRVHDLSVLIHVENTPRYRRVGEVEFIAQVRGIPEGQAFDRTEFVGRRILVKAVDLPWRNSRYLVHGATVSVRGDLSPLGSISAIGMSYEDTLFRRGIVGRMKARFVSKPKTGDVPLFSMVQVSTIRSVMKRRIQDVLGNTERSGVLLALLMGERDALTRQSDLALRRAGLAHVLVVSGLHVSLIYLFSIAFMRITRTFQLACFHHTIPKIGEHLFALLLSACFVLICGAQPAAVRALVAIVISVFAGAVGGMRLGWGALSLSLLVLSLIWQGCILDVGVQLSFAALIGILLALDVGGRRAFVRLERTANERLKSYFRICSYASFFSGLVSLAHFGRLSLLGFVLNPLLAPVFVAVGSKLGMVAFFAHLVGIDRHGYLLQLSASLLMLLKAVVVQLVDNTI